MKRKKDRKQIVVRFSDEEMNLINENVRRSRLSTQNYFRKLIRGERPYESPDDGLFSFMRKLNRIGTNLAQIGYEAIRHGLPDAGKYYGISEKFSKKVNALLNMMRFSRN